MLSEMVVMNSLKQVNHYGEKETQTYLLSREFGGGLHLSLGLEPLENTGAG